MAAKESKSGNSKFFDTAGATKGEIPNFMKNILNPDLDDPKNKKLVDIPSLYNNDLEFI